jgi:hypothetical protein
MASSLYGSGEKDAFWNAVDARADERIKIALREFERNYRPRGAVSIPLTIGTPGTAITTGTWINGAKVPFPMQIDEIHIVADVASDTTFDLQVQRPGQNTGAQASIVNGHYPELLVAGSPVQEIIINPVLAPLTGPGPVWSALYLEPDSLLYLLVRATDGVLTIATFSILGRCV